MIEFQCQPLTAMMDLTQGNVPLASYDYMGHSMVSLVDYGQPDVQFDRWAAHNGQRTTGTYPGFDKYGRVKRQLWVDGNFTTHASPGPVPNIPPIVEQLYTYDNASNRIGAFDARPGVTLPLSHRYEYDGLHRLKEARRGVWNGSEDPDLADATHTLNSQQWGLDLLGNWQTVSTETSGNGVFDPTTEQESRTHNEANKLLTRDPAGSAPALDLGYDLAGNLESEEIRNNSNWLRYTHDAWDRLVRIEFDNDGSPPYAPRAEYEYNGLNWRTVKRADTDLADGTHALTQQRLMYYSASWQLLEERIDDEVAGIQGEEGFAAGPDDPDIDRHVQYMWGPRYIDDIILHREHEPSGGSEQRWYHLTDVQFSTIAIVDASAEVAERVTYTAYGRARHHWLADVDGDGDHDATDQGIIQNLMGNDIDEPGYDAAADLNRDGTISLTDWLLASGSAPALPAGVLTDASPGAPDNHIGYDGYVFNGEVAKYLARNRTYSAESGRWMERDPAGYLGGLNSYEYVRSSPIDAVDPYGLEGDTGPESGDKICNKSVIRRELGIPAKARSLGKVLGIHELKAKYDVEVKKCWSCCAQKGRWEQTITYKVSFKLIGELGSKEIDKWGIKYRWGWYGRLTGSGSIQLDYSRCTQQHMGAGCVTVSGEFGGIASIGAGDWVQGGGRGGVNIAVSVCAGCWEGSCGIRTRVCIAFRARLWGKLDTRWAGSWQYHKEWEVVGCTPWHYVVRIDA